MDVYVPTAEGWTIYQIKSFTGSLTSSHKSQITSSWNEFNEWVQTTKQQIKAWHLLRPENPTWQDTDWLSGLTDGAPFFCSWRGLDYLDGLSAEFPNVIDYYFGNGKQLLEESLRLALSAASLQHAPGNSVLEPSGIVELKTLSASINLIDPHYRYDFSVLALPYGAPLPPPPSDRPGLIASLSRRERDTVVQFDVYSRYDGATDDRPVPGKFQLRYKPGSPEELAVQDLLTYGTPLTDFPINEVTVDLPGGLAEQATQGRVTFLPQSPRAGGYQDLTWLVFPPGSNIPVAEVEIVVESVTAGLLGNGQRMFCRERHGVFDFELRFNSGDKTFQISFASRDLTGALPVDLLPGLRLLSELRSGNRVQLRVRGGEPFQPPTVLTTNVGDPHKVVQALEVCEALAKLALHLNERFTFPNLAEVASSEIEKWVRAAQLISGQSIKTTWAEVAFTVDFDGAIPEVGAKYSRFSIRRPLLLSIAGKHFSLGAEELTVTDVRLDSITQDEGNGTGVICRLVPTNDDTAVIRLLVESEHIYSSEPTE